MAEEIEFRLKFNDEELLNGLDRTKTATNEIKEGIDEVNKSSADLGKTLNDSANEANEGFSDLNDSVLNSSKILDSFLSKIKIGGTSLKDLKNTFKEITANAKAGSKSVEGIGNASQAAAKGTGILSKAFRFLKIAIASTGIGLLVVALGSLVAYFIKSGKAASILEKVMTAIGVTVKVITDRFAKLGESVLKVLKGDFSGASKTAKEAMQGLGKEITETIRKTNDLNRAVKDLEDAYRVFGLTQVKAQKVIDDLLETANDQTKSYAERINAANQAKERSIALAQQEEILAQENLKNQQAAFALSEKGKEDLDDLIAAQILYEQAKNNTFKAERDADKVIKAISEDRKKAIEDERQKIEKLKETYEKLVAKFNEATQKIDFSKLSPKDQAKAVLKQTLAEIDLAAGVIRETAVKLGIALPEGFEEGVKKQEDEAGRVFSSAIKELFGAPDRLPNILDNKAALEAIFKVKKEKLTPVVEKYWAEAFNDLKLNFASKFQKIFDLGSGETDEAFKLIAQSGQSVFASFQTIIAENFQAAINKADQEIAAIQERIQGVNSALEEERRKQQAGYANDVALLENKLTLENQALEKAEREKIEIQKKQARQQLVIDAALQSSQIVSGVAKLLSDGASKGLVGIFTATAGIALLFSLLAKSKAQANQFTQIPKFREGTEYLSGKSHEQGGVLIEAEGGERILSKKLNNKLRMTNEELVDFAILGQNMTRKLGLLAQENRSTLHQYELMNAMMQREAISESIYGAMNQNADRVIGYWQTRPVIIPTSNGTIAESWEGSTKVRRKYRAI
jgi:methyl-accepting chemotaxis protein